MEDLQHFSHQHKLSLVQLHPTHNNKNSDNDDEDDEDEDKRDFVEENRHGGQCNMCKEDIYSFHLCYYSCKDCNYSLHKFFAELITTQQNHPLHPGHNLTLSVGFQFQDSDSDIMFKSTFESDWTCAICKIPRKMFYNYHCSICAFNMDIICATMPDRKMENPSHAHQLQRYYSWMTSLCYACGNKHSGTFYHCNTCSWYRIHLDCALLPAKLLIQQSTNESFSHPHLLTISYSFPFVEKKAKFYPRCRVCDDGFSSYQWHYRCDKCRYYVHTHCVTSMEPTGLGKTSINFQEDDHPGLIHCPFPDESFSLLKHHFFNKDEFILKGRIDSEIFNHFSHRHPLILLDTQTSILNQPLSLHDPMKKVELSCDGCVRPITALPFYKCTLQDCGFVLHEWCTRLPSEILGYPGHPEHTLSLLPKIPTNILGLFRCNMCSLPSNGFAYGCVPCKYYVDIHCAFIPDVITHEAHPNHLLITTEGSPNLSNKYCKTCRYSIRDLLAYQCLDCDFYMHAKCALLLPRIIRHRYDKHPLSLRYHPVENHISEYFCEIYEEEFNPEKLFYHCSMCATSMHTACVLH